MVIYYPCRNYAMYFSLNDYVFLRFDASYISIFILQMYREKHVKFSNHFLLKEENLVSGFRESGIFPIHEEEVLKRMNTLDVEHSQWECC